MGVVRRISRDSYLRLVPDARARLEPAESVSEAIPVGDYIFWLGRKREDHEEAVEWLREQEIPYTLQPSTTGLYVEFADDAGAVLFMVRFV